MTFLLVVVVAAVATTAKVPAGVAALAIGFALAAAILISGPLTGAEVNPARAIGPGSSRGSSPTGGHTSLALS